MQAYAMVIHATEADTIRVFAGDCMWPRFIIYKPRVVSARKEIRQQSQSGDRQERNIGGRRRGRCLIQG